MIGNSRFYKAVRQFAVTAPVWSPDAIRYFTKPDEHWDLTLVSQRVYGNRDDFLAVMASAGLSRFDEPLTERQLVLPSKTLLESIKAQTGYQQPQVVGVR